MTHRLSKSRILAGLQCPKRLYLQVHHPEWLVENPQAERRVAVGHQVGEIARELYPGGKLIEHADNLSLALAETRQLLAEGEPLLYEATFEYDGVLIRADILSNDDKGCRFIEVKSSTRVKAYHWLDCAVQSWVLEGAGYTVSSASVACINRDFIYPGHREYQGLLITEDITTAVNALKVDLPGQVTELRALLDGSTPAITPGDQCFDPFDCPFIEVCSPVTTEYPVTLFPRGKKVAEDLLAEGIGDIRQIPAGYLDKEQFERIRRVTVSGEYELDSELTETLNGLGWPRYYLDFETITFAVPIWKGTRPYEQLPFQWSCHIEPQAGVLEHAEYLDTTGASPMRSFTESLITQLGDTGPIIVYSSFEATRLRESATRFPDLADALQGVMDRLVDLLPLTRDHYYHPAMKGSFSIKAVLPTVAPELDYKKLNDVHDGSEAQLAYLEMVNAATPANRKAHLQGALLEYCRLDTLAMVKLVHFFT